MAAITARRDTALQTGCFIFGQTCFSEANGLQANRHRDDSRRGTQECGRHGARRSLNEELVEGQKTRLSSEAAATRTGNDFVSEGARGRQRFGCRDRSERVGIGRQGRRGRLAIDADTGAGSAAVMLGRRSRAARMRRCVNRRSSGTNSGRIQKKKSNAEQGQNEFALAGHMLDSSFRECKPATSPKTFATLFGFSRVPAFSKVSAWGKSPRVAVFGAAPQRSAQKSPIKLDEN